MSEEKKLFGVLALVELYQHKEVLRTVYELIEPFTGQIHIFTSEEIRSDLQEVGIGLGNDVWHISKKQESPGAALVRWTSDLMACDGIFLLTLNRPFAAYSALPFLDKTVLLIHNVHAFLAPWEHMPWQDRSDFKAIWRALRFLLFGEFRHLNQILNHSFIWAFPSHQLLRYARSQQWIPEGKAVIELPLALPGINSLTAGIASPVVNICIPGTIKKNGRDYTLLYEGIKAVLESTDRKMRLCLLGSPRRKYGQKVQADFLALANRHAKLELVYYEELVPQRIYDEELQRASFLILPLTFTSRYDAFIEYLGTSTISGAINDMARFGIPAIIPDFYPLDPNCESLVERYKNKDDLVKILISWIGTEKYKELRNENIWRAQDHSSKTGNWAVRVFSEFGKYDDS